jgi:1-phosphofructokinase
MNPAIDIFIAVKDLIPKAVNRSTDQDVQPNGKGVNISFILKKLAIDSTSLGFSAGFSGKFIEDELTKAGIASDFVQAQGITRLNVFTYVSSQDVEYKLVNPGPQINQKEIDLLFEKLKNLNSKDILCVSGSLPKGIGHEINVQIAKLSLENGFKFVLDSSSPNILEILFCKPYLLKPNIDELALWFGCSNIDNEQALKYGRELISRGAQNVIVSLGADGAFYINEDCVFYANAPKGKVINTACAGDTLLAVFLAGLIKQDKIDETLRYAVAAASSTAFRAGLTDFSDVDELTKQVKVQNRL